MKISSALFSAMLLGFSCSSALAADSESRSEVVRYRDLAGVSDVASILSQRETNVTLEFITGDKIPLGISWNSDVFELEQPKQPINFVVKTGFILKFDDNSAPLISFDGNNYVPLQDAFKGTMSVKAGSGEGTPNRVSLVTFLGGLFRKK